jgi:holo-[acyl-carrier protein] synthase
MIANQLENDVRHIIEFKKENLLAIGNDIIYLPHFEKSLTPEFINKVFAPEELGYIRAFSDPVLRYASTFAAKEAVYKCFKQLYPDQTMAWKSIKIIRKMPSGKPDVMIDSIIYNSIHKIILTMSHDKDYVWAIAIIIE